MKAYFIDTHLLVPRSRSSAKVKVKYQGHVSQQMNVSGALMFHKHILFWFISILVVFVIEVALHTVSFFDIMSFMFKSIFLLTFIAIIVVVAALFCTTGLSLAAHRGTKLACLSLIDFHTTSNNWIRWL